MKLKELLVEGVEIKKVVAEAAVKKTETQGQGTFYGQYAHVELNNGKDAIAFRKTDEEGKSGEYTVTSSSPVGDKKYIKTKYSYYKIN
jgi:hypothetical protein